jgi:hypothetical protein
MLRRGCVPKSKPGNSLVLLPVAIAGVEVSLGQATLAGLTQVRGRS